MSELEHIVRGTKWFAKNGKYDTFNRNVHRDPVYVNEPINLAQEVYDEMKYRVKHAMSEIEELKKHNAMLEAQIGNLGLAIRSRYV